MPTFYLLLAACAHVETAPEVWPESSCEAETPDPQGVAYRHRDFLLEVSDGVRIEVEELVPQHQRCWGAVVLVPPGFQGGLWLLETTQATQLAEANLLIVAYNPRGRGGSEGEEDANGSRGQDDLAELMRRTADQDGVDADLVVLVSRSFGAAAAAGALGRHADLAPVAWVDYEGPAWPSEELPRTEGQARETFEAMVAEADDPDAWWAEREPAGFIGEVTADYHRIQGIPDHALGDYVDHARAMVDHALQAPLVTYNGVPIDPPLGEERAWELAVDGGVEPGGHDVTEQILAAFR